MHEPVELVPADQGPTWKSRGLRFLKEGVILLALLLVMTTVMGKLRAPDLPDAAPDFALKTLDGKVVHLSDYRGKKVVLNFWATWCTPCRVEIPLINSFVGANDDVIVLGIATDGRNKKLAEHVRKLGITYPVLRGTNAVVKTYGASTVPTTVFVDENGHISGAHVGIITQFQLWWGTL